MYHWKNCICLILLLALLACPLSVSADAAGMGQIDTVPINFSIPPVVAGEVSALSATISAAGCYISSMVWYDMYGQPMTGVFSYDNATVVITVNASPGYFFSGNVQVGINGEYAPYENRGSQLVISKTFSPVIWAPNIVKHPGSETVMAGGMVSFVALASFTTESAWTIIDTEGKHYSIDALAEKFPELIFYTTYSKLNMGPIPAAMNGYKVRCSFTGPGGTVASSYAEIIVEEPPVVYEQSPATPVPTPEHSHSYSTDFSQDAGCHWYACDCGAVWMKEEHDFTWIQTREATLDAPGLVEARCSLCGYGAKLRTQLDPQTVEKLKAEAAATPAPTPSPSPSPSPRPDLIDKLSGLFDFLSE